MAQTQAFVQNVFAEADANNTGMVSRKALHQALEDQDDEAMAIFGGQESEKEKLKKRAKHLKNYVIDEGEVREVPLQTATVESVMQVLEQSENGKLAKREVAEAIQAVAEQQQIVLDSVALDALVSNVFSTADSNAEGAVSRKALHNALANQTQVAELFTLKTLPVAMNTVTQKVMVQLNAQSNGKITSRDLKEALKTVAQQNGAQVDLAQSKALIEKVFLTDNQLSRGEVRKALDENQVEAAHIVKETALPASTPVIQQVMQVLEASDAGMIDKVTLQAALKQVAKDERIVIDAALTTGFVQQVFQSADSDNQGEVTRQKVEMALASHNVEAFQLFKEQVVVPVQSDSVSKKLMNVLSTSQKGTITAKDLKEALKVVATQNGQTASSSTCNAFVDKVFLEADSDNSGQITRSQLREFIEDNQVEAAQVVKETTKVSSNPVTLSVIQTLEESESGVFDKKQVAAAVKQVAVENGVTLNSVALQSMVSKVFAEADFNTQGTINRQALHTALDSHAVEAEALFQDKHITVKNDPVVAKVLNVLEGSETGLVTKADLRQALKTAVSANGKQIDSAQSNALIEQVYFAVDSDRSGQITRSQLREGLD